VFKGGLLGLLPVVVEVGVFGLLLDLDEEFLGVGAYLCAVPSSYKCLNFFPILSIELQTLVSANLPSINFSCSSLLHLPLLLDSSGVWVLIFRKNLNLL